MAGARQDDVFTLRYASPGHAVSMRHIVDGLPQPSRKPVVVLRNCPERHAGARRVRAGLRERVRNTATETHFVAGRVRFTKKGTTALDRRRGRSTTKRMVYDPSRRAASLPGQSRAAAGTA